MRGSVQRRGRNSWRLKFDLPSATGRETRYVTMRGTRKEAERELARLVNGVHNNTLIEPTAITVGDYLRSWLKGVGHGLAGKTLERYQQIAEQQIVPHLGGVPLQKLKPADIAQWHERLLISGGKDGRPLSARTVNHCHRILHKLLERALGHELVARNVAHAVKPPKVEQAEIEILKADQIGVVLAALGGHALQPIAVLALSTGARRGEILALRWGDINLDLGTVCIERSLEQTKAGLKIKSPKTRSGKRSVSLPPIAVDVLQAHRRRQLELRLAFGQGRPNADTLVFGTIDGDPIPPNNLSRDWARFVKSRKLPGVSFHALRHSHASALIASGIDPLTVSRRIGHASTSTTMNLYSHMFEKTDALAANAIEAALSGRERR